MWVDGVHVAAHQPFSRNTSSEFELTLDLASEGSDVVLLIEEMAERDTQYFVELTWAGEAPLVAQVPVAADPETLRRLMALARDVHPTQVAFLRGQPVTIGLDGRAPLAVDIQAEIPRSVHLKHLPPLVSTRATLAPGQTSLSLGVMDELGDGYHSLDLTLSVGETQVRRQIAFALVGSLSPTPADPGVAQRKSDALAFSAQHGERRIGRLLAMMARGLPFDDTAQAIFADTIDGINSRRDCSDFVMVPLLWLMSQHQDALPQIAATQAREAILNYRYWMDEPGNDTMWFWSENHVLCFHVSEYLAGHLYPDAVFPNAGISGQDHAALAEGRLDRWLTSVEEHGLAEWNSAAYYPIDFIGLFALAHLANPPLADRAREQLDRLFTMIALHTIGGVSAGSMGRAYDKELRAGPMTELSPFAYVAFGTGWLNGAVAALPMFCLSDYVPPVGLDALAAPQPGTSVSANYVQGYGAQGRLALYKTANVQLSAAISGVAGSVGHQQHLLDIQCAGDPFARIWINHPGHDDPWGDSRPSFWAGNGLVPHVGMAGDTALMLFDTSGARPDFTHAYAPISQFDAHVLGDDFLVLTCGLGAAILKATGAITPVAGGPGRGIEWRCAGPHVGWAAQVLDIPKPGHEGGLDLVVARARAMSLTLTADGVLRLCSPGAAELALCPSQGLLRDATPCPFPTHSQIPQILTTVGLKRCETRVD